MHDGPIDNFQVMVGVHQGNILSPLLFNIFIEDICDVLQTSSAPTVLSQKVPCMLYADDLVIMSTTAEGLQESIN